MQGKNLIVSIIVPCERIDSYIKECVDYCKKLNYETYEIIVLPDEQNENIEGVKAILTSNETLREKGNITNGNFKDFGF